MKKNIIYIVLLLVLGAVAFVPGVKEFIFPVAKIEEAVHIDNADYNIELKGINTTSTNLKNLKGKKMVFLNFWGTWCKPCREEWKSIQNLYDAKKDKVDFVLIAMMDKEEEVRKFLQEHQYTAPVYIAESPISENLLPKVFPTTFLLDKNGRILLKETASKDWNTAESKTFIDQMAQQ
ncbi:alkyl hydroperoxide reductase [Bergeyella porcorum]|uniref:Alkyl hydroperoxide reductase n=1 Tax=Bergeyella porcorum TaxID=1735111 RepID=A0AAU0F0V3_9FLAO